MYVKVIHAAEEKQHVLVNLRVFHLRVGSYARQVQFKIISTPQWFGLEFRNSVGADQLFSTWPGTEKDKFGEKFIFGTGRDFSSLLAKVCRQGLPLLAWLFRVLQKILQAVLNEAEISSVGRGGC